MHVEITSEDVNNRFVLFNNISNAILGTDTDERIKLYDTL